MDTKYVQLFQTILDQKESIQDNLEKVKLQILRVIEENANLPNNQRAESHLNVSMEMVTVLGRLIEINYTLESMIKDQSPVVQSNVPIAENLNCTTLVPESVNSATISVLETESTSIPEPEISPQIEPPAELGQELEIPLETVENDSDESRNLGTESELEAESQPSPPSSRRTSSASDSTETSDNSMIPVRDVDSTRSESAVDLSVLSLDESAPIQQPSSVLENTLVPVHDVDCTKSESVEDPSVLSSEENVPVQFPPVPDRPTFSALMKLLHHPVHDRDEEMSKKRVRFNMTPRKFELVKAPPSPNGNVKKSKPVVIPGPSFEMLEDVLVSGQTCHVCYVVSPTEFHVQTNKPLADMVTSSLNEEMNKNFFVKSKYTSKEDARNVVGDFCVAYIPIKASYHRVKVVDWMTDNPDDEQIVLVQLVDFGDKFYSEYHYLRRLTEVFATVPALAFPCTLAYVMPLENNEGVWPISTIEVFLEYTNGLVLDLIYVSKEGSVYGVDMCLQNCEQTISELLIQQNLAKMEVQLPPTLEQIEKSNDEDLSEYENEDNDEDFSEYDNIEEALLGYEAKDVARICPFTNSSGGCFKGARCKLDHEKLSKDGITTDKVETFIQAFNEFPLPNVDDCINVVVTGFVTCCSFYIHIINDKSESGPFNQNFCNLMDAMQSKENVYTYEPMRILPSPGEIVMVKYSDGNWLRAKCLRVMQTSVQLFLVDFGTKFKCRPSDLFKVKEEFLHLPFQAIQCILYNVVPRLDADLESVLDFYQESIHLRDFCATVVSNTPPLSLGLYNSDDFLDLGHILEMFGYANAEFNDLRPSDDCILRLD